MLGSSPGATFGGGLLSGGLDGGSSGGGSVGVRTGRAAPTRPPPRASPAAVSPSPLAAALLADSPAGVRAGRGHASVNDLTGDDLVIYRSPHAAGGSAPRGLVVPSARGTPPLSRRRSLSAGAAYPPSPAHRAAMAAAAAASVVGFHTTASPAGDTKQQAGRVDADGTPPPGPAAKAAGAVSLLGRQLAGLEAPPTDPHKPPLKAAQAPAPVLDAEALLEAAAGEHAVFNTKAVRRAFAVARSAHEGQTRRSGEAVIEHCVETAKLCAGLGADETVVAAALLHQTLDVSMMTEERLRSLVPGDVADLVSGVSRMNSISEVLRAARDPLGAADIRAVRDMILSMADVLALLIKLADRVNAMRVIDNLEPDERETVARETIEVFAPLAHRLGIWTLKNELEDRCFNELNREEYDALAARTGDEVERASITGRVDELRASLSEAGIEAKDVVGRPKNLYGIYKKMRDKGLAYEDVHDVRALRVVVETEEECYAVLDAVHSMWSEVDGRRKDYISEPKANGYQSLHTVVLDADGRPFEVQVRTQEMHFMAEYGVAAHWRYKESLHGGSRYLEKRVAHARYMLSFQCGLIEDGKCHGESAPVACSLPAFPEHAEWCPAAGFDGVGVMPKCACGVAPHDRRSAEAPDETAAPVFVVVVDDDQVFPRELAPGARLRDVLSEDHAASIASGALCVTVNNEPCAALEWEGLDGDEGDLVLKTGDTVSLLWASPAAPPQIDLSPAAVERTRGQLQSLLASDDRMTRPGSWEDLEGAVLTQSDELDQAFLDFQQSSKGGKNKRRQNTRAG